MNKERRKDMRLVLVYETVNIFDSNGIGYFRKLRDISMGGAYIEDIALKPNEYANISIDLPGDLGKFPINFKVKRVDWAKTKKRKQGIAVEFCDMSESNKNILSSYITYMRNRQIVSVSKRIIEEFFGRIPPKK